MNPQDAWKMAFSQLELQFDRATFDTWLRDAVFLRCEEGVFVVGVGNSYARDMLEHRLYKNIWRVLSDVCGYSVQLRFEVHKPEPVAKKKKEDMPLFRLLAEQDSDTPSIPLHQQVMRPKLPDLPESELNPRYTFERFVVSAANRMVYEAARAVSERPTIYNPFFVYGGVGLGKTHALQAIAHALRNKGQRVIYISSEVFTNDLIDAIRQRTTAMFRDKYRSVDALLVDDIQFIAGKESTQEEFFHTFNTLYTFNKQIVLASDRHPSQLEPLADRLRSRFEGGLVVDIQPPEYETRLAIIEMWSRERGIRLAPQVAPMIADRVQNNVRELEGIFNRIAAETQLGFTSVTRTAAETTLNHYESPRQHIITVAQVVEAAARHFGIRASDLTGSNRSQRINQARQVAIFLARDITGVSFPQIGAVFGKRSHTTMLHAYNKICEEISGETPLRETVEKIRAALVK